MYKWETTSTVSFIPFNNCDNGTKRGDRVYVSLIEIAAIEGYKENDNYYSIIHLKSGKEIKVLGRPRSLIKDFTKPLDKA